MRGPAVIAPTTRPVATDALQETRALCPVDTGALRDTIHLESEPDGSHAVLAGGPEAPHAVPVEFGGEHTRAQPFVQTGTLRTANRAAPLYARGARVGIRRAAAAVRRIN